MPRTSRRATATLRMPRAKAASSPGGSCGVRRAERFPAAGGADRDQGISLAMLGLVEQFPQKIHSEARHVAGDDQIPVSRGISQRRQDASQGTFPG